MPTSQNLSDSLSDIVGRYFPAAWFPPASNTLDASQLSQTIYSDTHYTDNEKVEIGQWITTSARLATPDEDEAKHAERLSSLNTHLSPRTTLLGSKPSLADVALYTRLKSTVQKWSPEERSGEKGYHNIVRYIDFVQNAPMFKICLQSEDNIAIDPNDVRFVHKPIDAKEEKERKKKEKAEAAGVSGEEQKPLVVGQGKGQEGSSKRKNDEARNIAEAIKENPTPMVAEESTTKPKKEKKEKQPKAQKQPLKETPLSPCLIDLRVGHILKAINHPNADSLYVSTIACGDEPGTENTSEYEGQVVRTVCSGLNGLVPLEEMQGRKIVAVCNLKPVTMRGIKSAAMVLAASPRLAEGETDNHGGPVELVTPPTDAKAGERIYFEGWQGEPEGVLNPKKKVWETIQPGFTTTDDLRVAFDVANVPLLGGEASAGKPTLGKLLASSGGKCTVKSLQGALVR